LEALDLDLEYDELVVERFCLPLMASIIIRLVLRLSCIHIDPAHRAILPFQEGIESFYLECGELDRKTDQGLTAKRLLQYAERTEVLESLVLLTGADVRSAFLLL
jgi:hypothetical protein